MSWCTDLAAKSDIYLVDFIKIVTISAMATDSIVNFEDRKQLSSI